MKNSKHVWAWIRRVLLAVLSICTIASLPLQARAEVVISNTPNGTEGGSALSSTDWKALLFTTNADSARVNSVQVGLNPPGSTSPGSPLYTPLPATLNAELLIYTVVGGQPVTQIASTGLQPINMSQRKQMYPFVFPATVRLAPNTTYALVLRSDATGIKWGNQGNSGQGGTSPTAFAGYVYNGFSETVDTGVSWSSSTSLATLNAVSIDVTFLDVPIPTLSQWAGILMVLMLMVGAVWAMARKRF